MRIAGLLLLLALPAPGQQVEGQVVNAVTGAPVRNAVVTLRRAEVNRVGPVQSYGAVTDAGGRFAIQAEPGRFGVTVRRAGFITAEYGARGAGRQGAVIPLSPGQQLKDVAVRLTPAAAVTGRVVDENGDPLTYMLVSLLRFRYADGRRQLVSEAGETTNDLGEYRVFWLPPGRYYVSARSGRADELRGLSSVDGTHEAYMPTYYPGTTDVASAAAIDVQPGAQIRGIDFVLSRVRAVGVRGRVHRPAELARGQITLMLQPRGRIPVFDSSRQVVAGGQGAFEFRSVTPGAYTLIAVVEDGSRTLCARQPVDVGGANVENLNVVVTPGVEVAGQVREEGTEAPNFAGAGVTLRPRDPANRSFGRMPSGGIQENGAFSLANVSSDIYTLQVFGLPGGYWVKSVRAGADDALENGLDLTRGAPQAVSVVVAPNAGQVEGTVMDAKQQPVSGGTVVLVPEPRRRARDELYRNAATDEHGRFTLRSIDPGDYKLFAWEDVETGAWMDPDFLKPLESEGRTVTIREGSRESVELRAR